MQPEGHSPQVADEGQLLRLRMSWRDVLDGARVAGPGSAAFARLVNLSAVFTAAWIKAGRRDEARAVAGDALAVMRDACRGDRQNLATHLAFGRMLELAAAVEGGAGDRHGSFEALRAAISMVGRFAPALRERASDPLERIEIASALLRPIATAARMVDDPAQRRAGFNQVWEESRAWAAAATGATDHAVAVEWAVLAALDLAVEEHADGASDCLQRCEDLRPHLEELARVRGEDSIVRRHRASLARLSADAWARLGDLEEARLLLDEAARHLEAAGAGDDADARAIESQRMQLDAQREMLMSRRARPGATQAKRLAR